MLTLMYIIHIDTDFYIGFIRYCNIEYLEK
jgi:hypothetical protein